MVLRTPAQLRATAAHLRGLASQGGDLWLHDALQLVAEELEVEAAKGEIAANISSPQDGGIITEGFGSATGFVRLGGVAASPALRTGCPSSSE
jgi:hypothetical protein